MLLRSDFEIEELGISCCSSIDMSNWTLPKSGSMGEGRAHGQGSRFREKLQRNACYKEIERKESKENTVNHNHKPIVEKSPAELVVL